MQDLEDILFDNMKDCECNSDHVNHDNVFEKFSPKEMLEISCDEYPVRRREAKNKKLAGKNFPS